MHPIVLSSLVELTENPKSIRHLLTWRGTNNDPNNANKFIRYYTDSEIKLSKFQFATAAHSALARRRKANRGYSRAAWRAY